MKSALLFVMVILSLAAKEERHHHVWCKQRQDGFYSVCLVPGDTIMTDSEALPFVER